MKNEIKIAKELVKLAKYLVAVNADENDDEPIHYTVWQLDTWGNEKDGWQVNDRREIGSFECNSDMDDNDIKKAFEQILKKKGYKVIPFEYESCDYFCFVNDPKTGKYLFEIEADI